MTLNPLSLLEKAIDEHGSANILRERVALVREQLAASDQKLADAIALNAVQSLNLGQLNATIEQLTTQIRQQQTQIDVLNDRLKPPSHDTLHENETRILAELATTDRLTIEDLASALGVGPQTIELHLTTLAASNLAESMDSYLKTLWGLTIRGKHLMASRGMLH